MLDKLTHRAAATATNRHGTTATATRICRLPCGGHCFVPWLKEAQQLEPGSGFSIWNTTFELASTRRCSTAARSTYSPLAFCDSRDTSVRRFRLRIKRWR